MPNDNNEDLKQEIKLLKEEVDLLKKQLEENKKGDDRRHQEIKQLQQDHHKERIFYDKIGSYGALGTPLAGIIGLITWWGKSRKKTKDCSCSENSSDNKGKTDLSGIVEIIREVKK